MTPHLLFLLLSGVVIAGPLAPRLAPAPYHRLEDYELIPDEYIVMLHDGHTIGGHFEQIGIDLAANASVFQPISLINGYRARLDEYVIHEMVRYDPGVRHVEHDSEVKPILDIPSAEPSDDTRLPTRLYRRWQVYSDKFMWWFAVMGTAGKKVDFTDDQVYGETFDEGGLGVNVYVFDTGVRLTHDLFKNKAVNFKYEDNSRYVDEPNADSDGHGTHVAGIVRLNAPWSTIVNVKILGKGSTQARIVQAISDVTQEHNEYKNKKPDPNWKGSVINMSAAIGRTEPLGTALQGAYNAGIPFTTSAGNSNQEYGTSPCGYTQVQCVAAIDIRYEKASFSNYGKDITVIAPGKNIYSAASHSDVQFTRMSGTSMASPAVAGLMALFVWFEGLNSDTDKVYKRLMGNTVNGIVTGFNAATPNKLANSGLNNPYKEHGAPYAGAPGGELLSAQTVTASATGPAPTDPPPADDFEGGEHAVGERHVLSQPIDTFNAGCFENEPQLPWYTPTCADIEANDPCQGHCIGGRCSPSSTGDCAGPFFATYSCTDCPAS